MSEFKIIETQEQLDAVIGERISRAEKKAAEKAEKDMKEELQKALDKYGFVGLENDILKITYVEPTTKTAIDSKAVKRKYPKVFEECSKTSPVKGYIKIQVKGVED